MSDPNLVTTCNFNGHEYFVKMNATNNILELNVTDKQTGEDWQCCYDASYIENITQKTGNFKQFSIFVAMLKSGLLKTSTCVYLDLMTFDDLDALRNHRIRGPFSTYHMAQTNTNRRYLILTYTVEFDRIHYPLPLEYCGPPDPQILQQHIVRLEDEIVLLKNQTKHPGKNAQDTRLMSLQKRIDDLTDENLKLYDETRRLKVVERTPKNRNEIYLLQTAIKNLEKSVLSERKSHHYLVEKLRKDKLSLSRELDRVKSSEKILRAKLQSKLNSRDESLKRMSDDTGTRVKSRSVSPRACRSESWETQQPNRQHRSSRLKNRRKSRSDSDGSVHYTSPTTIHPSTSKRATKHKEPCPTSRSGSASSRCSSSSPKRESFSQTFQRSSPKGSRSRKNEFDFGELENRIQAVQKMLHEGLILP